MHSFHYQGGKLSCESYPLDKAAERFGTPLYVYSSHTIVDHYQRLDQALHELNHEVCYAVKANSNLSVLRLLAEQGSVFDIVSGGELYRVIKAGGNPSKCTFAGVGKSREEIEYALRREVLSFNIESEEELRALSPDHSTLRKIPVRGIIVTARSSNNGFDFVSRFFAPGSGIDEDPVTGSAHTALGPYWGSKLGKAEMTAFQASARGGVVRLRLNGGRIILGGQAVTLAGAVIAGAAAGLLGGNPRPVFAVAGSLTLLTVAAAWFTGLQKVPATEVAGF